MSDYLVPDVRRMKRDEGVYIPSDLWPDILKRVPARKLLQLRCVCKSWKSLISSSSFVSFYNLNTITTTSCVTGSGGSRLQWTTKFYDNKRGKLTVEQSCALQQGDAGNKFTPLGFPNIPGYRLDNVSSPGGMIHGVIFLRYVPVYFSDDESLLCVWNPCIRKHVILPCPMGQAYGHHPRSYFRLEGAWFDAASDDFKVVRSQLKGSYDLLSVRNGVWEMNLPFPTACLIRPGMKLCGGRGIFYNGSIHWIVGPHIRDDDQVARAPYQFLRFDCEREEFSVMDVPTQLVKGSWSSPKLFLLDLGAGTMLSLVKFLSTIPNSELWLMQPGSLSSWDRLDSNHPKFAAAAARDVISSSGLEFEPSLPHHGLFEIKDNSTEKFYHFKETMMLMDIGKPSSSKLHHRFTFD